MSVLLYSLVYVFFLISMDMLTCERSVFPPHFLTVIEYSSSNMKLYLTQVCYIPELGSCFSVENKTCSLPILGILHILKFLNVVGD